MMITKTITSKMLAIITTFAILLLSMSSIALATTSSSGGGGGGGGSSSSSTSSSAVTVLSPAESDSTVTTNKTVDVPNSGTVNAPLELSDSTEEVVIEIKKGTKLQDSEGSTYGDTLKVQKMQKVSSSTPLPETVEFVTGAKITTKSEVTFDTPVTITIPIPAETSGTPKLYRYTESTGTYDEVEGASVVDGNMVADVELSGTYVVAVAASGDGGEEGGEGEEGEEGETSLSTVEEHPFTDVEGHWAESYIAELYNEGVVNGKSEESYDPDGPLTRAELVKIVVEAFGYTAEGTSSYSDVSGHWAEGHIAAAAAAGIVDASKSTFRPDDPVNRAEALKILLEASGLSLLSETVAEFTDTNAEDWYAGYLNFAVENGVASGYSGEMEGQFGPGNGVTRGEIAKMASAVMGL